MPSFIGNFEKKKVAEIKNISEQLPIEKEADLRQKRKRILQRLKQNPEPVELASCCAEEELQLSSSLSANKPTFSSVKEPNNSLQKSIIFSHNTAANWEGSNVSKQPKLLTSSQCKEERKPEETSENNKKTGIKSYITKSRIPVPNPCESPPRARTHMKLLRCNKTEKRLRTSKNTEYGVSYVPSFLSGSDNKSNHNKRVSVIKQTVSKRNEIISKKQQDFKNSSCLTTSRPNLKRNDADSKNVPVINVERIASPLKLNEFASHAEQTLTSNDIENKSNNSDLYKDLGNKMVASKSLISLRESKPDNGSCVSRSLPISPELARRQQTKLEEDFKRVEETLDQTFKELRKYIGTSQ